MAGITCVGQFQVSGLLSMLRAALVLLAAAACGPGCRAQNEIETDPLAGTKYRIDGKGVSLVDIRTNLEP